MTKTVMAEYLADEQKLKLDEPLDGVANHEKIRIGIDLNPDRKGDRPWLELRDSLPAEVAEYWRRQMVDLSEPDAE